MNRPIIHIPNKPMPMPRSHDRQERAAGRGTRFIKDFPTVLQRKMKPISGKQILP